MAGEKLVEEIDWSNDGDYNVVIVGVKCSPNNVDKVTKAIKRALASLDETTKIKRRVMEKNREHG